MLRRVGAFVAAMVFMVVVGSATQTYFVQRAWSAAAGAAAGQDPQPIPLSDRLAWVWHDLLGILPAYAALTAAALIVAFFVAGGLARFTGARALVFGLAGAVALWVLFTTLRAVLGTVGIFGARGAGGLAAQAVVGLLAGVLFAKCSIRGVVIKRP